MHSSGCGSFSKHPSRAQEWTINTQIPQQASERKRTLRKTTQSDTDPNNGSRSANSFILLSYPIAYCGVIWNPADLGRFAKDDNRNPSMSLQLHSFPRYSGDILSMVISCKDDLRSREEKTRLPLSSSNCGMT